jgi:hypothetical protein
MRLPKPFYRLPVRFDAERLQQEVARLPASAWVAHPHGTPGNSALRLVSVDGGPNDEVDGAMRATPELLSSPYLCQVLHSFGVVWSRSRLMRLAPHAQVSEHADINYHWFHRVRVHIPVLTHPAVRFRCGDEAVNMAAGEAWIFDNWRRHSVVNASESERIHLVADTTGSASFWRTVAQSPADGGLQPHRWEPGAPSQLPLLEHTPLAAVMHPSEVDMLLLDLRAELQASADGPQSPAALAPYHALLDAFCRDWRQLYALYGEDRAGWPEFARLRDWLRSSSRTLGEGLQMRSNGVGAHQVLEGRLLRAALPAVPAPRTQRTARPAAAPGALRRPLFIIAAPRSGSTLLFETLAVHGGLCTLGGEAHGLVEDAPELRPEAVGSNRLEAIHATPAQALRMLATIARELRDSAGRPEELTKTTRLLEKTPKNALRVPFFNRLFPDAQFIFLWRDPRESLSSIIEAWRSGRWKTYNGLAGFNGPWSLLLPPGWQSMNGRPLEEIAAFQWEAANRFALDDLRTLPPERWTSVSYAELIADPVHTVGRLCAFAQLDTDAHLAARLAGPLPLSRFTQTPPEPGKWQRNGPQVERVLGALEPLWKRLEALPQSPKR